MGNFFSNGPEPKIDASSKKKTQKGISTPPPALSPSLPPTPAPPAPKTMTLASKYNIPTELLRKYTRDPEIEALASIHLKLSDDDMKRYTLQSLKIMLSPCVDLNLVEEKQIATVKTAPPMTSARATQKFVKSQPDTLFEEPTTTSNEINIPELMPATVQPTQTLYPTETQKKWTLPALIQESQNVQKMIRGYNTISKNVPATNWTEEDQREFKLCKQRILEHWNVVREQLRLQAQNLHQHLQLRGKIIETLRQSNLSEDPFTQQQQQAYNQLLSYYQRYVQTAAS